MTAEILEFPVQRNALYEEFYPKVMQRAIAASNGSPRDKAEVMAGLGMLVGIMAATVAKGDAECAERMIRAAETISSGIAKEASEMMARSIASDDWR